MLLVLAGQRASSKIQSTVSSGHESFHTTLRLEDPRPSIVGTMCSVRQK